MVKCSVLKPARTVTRTTNIVTTALDVAATALNDSRLIVGKLVQREGKPL